MELAHIREQGQNMLLFPLDRSFAQKTSAEKHQILEELQERAHGAGLAGRAAVFWESAGRTHSLGPKAWGAFLSSISLRHVLANINKTISW
jgi:hypothetical protein